MQVIPKVTSSTSNILTLSFSLTHTHQVNSKGNWFGQLVIIKCLGHSIHLLAYCSNLCWPFLVPIGKMNWQGYFKNWPKKILSMVHPKEKEHSFPSFLPPLSMVWLNKMRFHIKLSLQWSKGQWGNHFSKDHFEKVAKVRNKVNRIVLSSMNCRAKQKTE